MVIQLYFSKIFSSKEQSLVESSFSLSFSIDLSTFILVDCVIAVHIDRQSSFEIFENFEYER